MSENSTEIDFGYILDRAPLSQPPRHTVRRCKDGVYTWNIQGETFEEIVELDQKLREHFNSARY